MSRFALLLFVACISTPAARAQLFTASPCLPHGDYAPALTPNPGSKVTFQCASATPLDLIRAVGFQTRTPIGVALGRDTDALTRAAHPYDLQAVDVQTALSAAIEGTGYSLHDENGVVVLIAGDLAPRQRDLLLHPYSNFGTYTNPGAAHADKMACWGISLTIALRQAARPMSGFMVSCSTSPNDEVFALNLPPSPTTEQIADAIVSQGSHGIWIFKVPASPPPGDPTEEIDLLPYQHYTNRPVIQR